MNGKNKLKKTTVEAPKKVKKIKTKVEVGELIESMSYQELYDLAKGLGLEYSKRPKKSLLIDDINKNK